MKYRQSLPLDLKIAMTRTRIREFIDYYGTDEVYVSFSGGKDSTVLLDMVRQDFPKVEAVFLDTWLEYPQIRQYVNGFKNVKIIKPEKSMKQIVDDDGWCFPSKDVAEAIDAYRRGLKWGYNKLHGLDKNGNPSIYRERYVKWLRLADEFDGKISHKCCLDMKERPVEKYERISGKKPMVALLADESARRKEAYLRTGCNSFDSDRPISKPMGFWTENDVLEYIYTNKIEIAEPYGIVIPENGQITMFCDNCKFKTTGESRTGCMFCPVACHLDNFAKIERVKKYNKSIYDYIMEELNMKRLVEYVKDNYVKRAK